MTFVNVKRRFRRSCIIITFFAMWFLVGCDGAKLTTRAYPLGQFPKTTEKIVNEIATDQVKKNLDSEQEWSNQRMLIKTLPEEGRIVVKTTPEGHRQIKATLQHLEEQSNVSKEN